MGVLSGKAVMITGASRGIGAAAARAMASAGADVLLLARSQAEVETLAAELRSGDVRAEVRVCDVGDYAGMAAAAERCQAAFGRIDALISNAAVIDPIAPLAATDPAAWGNAIAINVTGVYNGMRAVLPAMITQGAGTIVTVGSGAAHNPLEGWSAYCSSKAAAFMLTRCAHLENKGRGIRVMSLSPGTVATDMQRKIQASGINPVSQIEFSQHIPPEAPAQALVWMCTDAAAEYAGEEISLRDAEMRARIGLE